MLNYYFNTLYLFLYRRPEITVVCARPMSEVGFRDQSEVINSQLKPTSLNVSQSKPSSDNASQSQGDPPNKPVQKPGKLISLYAFCCVKIIIVFKISLNLFK